jgi:membrane protein YdbS with pleckstrin-like domain
MKRYKRTKKSILKRTYYFIKGLVLLAIASTSLLYILYIASISIIYYLHNRPIRLSVLSIAIAMLAMVYDIIDTNKHKQQQHKQAHKHTR